MRSIHFLAPLCAVSLLFSGCLLFDDDALFRKAVPSEKSVTVNAPSGQSSRLALTLGETSDYYVTTRSISEGVNTGVLAFLHLVQSIVELPPTTREADKRVWGPGADALDPAYYRLTVTRVSDNVFTYVLDARPKGSPDEEEHYLPLITGNADVTSGVNDGIGDMTLHFDNMAALDPTVCGGGTLVTTYDTVNEPQFLAVDFLDFYDCNAEDSDGMRSATYYYDRFADGSGDFQFVAQGDVQGGARLPVVDETYAIRSRWNATGAGRSDVLILGGDLPLDSLTQVAASECWDELFLLTYADVDPIIVDPSHALGAVESCPAGMQEPEYATDLEQ